MRERSHRDRAAVDLGGQLAAVNAAASGGGFSVDGSGAFSTEVVETRTRSQGPDVRRWRVGGQVVRESRDGPLIMTRLCLEAVGPAGRGVDASTLRSLEPSVLLGEASRRLVALDQATRRAYGAFTGREPEWPAVPPPRRAVRVRPPARDRHLRDLAEARLKDHEEHGSGRGVYERLGQLFLDGDGQPTPPAVVKAQMTESRRAGWLAPNIPGLRVPQPGPRLLAAWSGESR